MSRPRASSSAPRLLPLLIAGLALAGCESDAAELAREINAAREGCTQEKLRAGDEECVQMMQRYAEMGTEAMRSYIGAVRALDQALQRMPPAQLDTAGLGHAITPSLRPEQGPLGDSPSHSAATAWEPLYDQGEPRPRRDPRLERDPRDELEEEYYDPRDARRAVGPGYDTRGYGAWQPDPRDYDRGAYDPRYAPGPNRGGGYDPRGGYPGQWDDPRWSAPRGGAWDDPRRPRDVPDRGWEEEWDERDRTRPRTVPRGAYPDAGRAPPERGRLLPPEERLRRPWIREEGRGPGPRPRGSALPPLDSIGGRAPAPPRPARVPQH